METVPHTQSTECAARKLWFAVSITIFGLLTLAAHLHAQTYVDLYEFNCNVGGCYPSDHGQLTQGADGNLYGTTLLGGLHDFGTIFQLTTGGADTDLWAFDGITGDNVFSALTLAADGNYYGTAQNGGSFDNGTVYRFSPPSAVTVLHSFSESEGVPECPPVQGKDGNLYGVTNSGTTYSVTIPAGTYKQLQLNATASVGAPLLLASDGNLYGAAGGGTNGKGVIFRMATPGGAIKVIHNFNGTDGSNAVGSLVQAPDGNLYGTTSAGGPNNNGEIFKMTLTGKITVLHTFDINGVSDGELPNAGLLAASDGYLYGVNSGGGASQLGTLFRITTGGAYTKLFDFTGVGGPVPGAFPGTALTQHTNGNLYGSVFRGGSSDNGVFFSLQAPNLSQILKVAGPIFVLPGGPVEILGNNLTHAIFVNFGSVQAQFQPGSDNYLTATVPTQALDATISVTYDTGLQTQTLMAVHILPVITNLDPPSGPVGTVVDITGGGFTGAKKVTFGGVAATSFNVLSPSLIQATVPTGAKTGKVKVGTPNGTATSPMKFTVQ